MFPLGWLMGRQVGKLVAHSGVYSRLQPRKESPYGQNTRAMWRLADPTEYVLAAIMNVLSCAIDSIGHACWPWCRASLIKNYYCEMNIWQPRTASSGPNCRAGSGCRMRSGPPWPRSPNDSDAKP